SGGPGPVARALFFHTIVMPRIDLIPEPKWGTVMSVQHSPLASSGAWGAAATIAWAALFLSALFALASPRANPRVPFALFATLAGQVLLHLVYGEETFLYALHVAPLLVLIAALGAASRWRPLILILAVIVACTAAMNNMEQLGTALRFFSRAS